VTIGLVQANVDQGQKWDERFRQETMERYLRLTRAAGQNADLIVWPEAATPFIYEMEGAYQKTVSNLIQQLDTPLLFGSPAVRRYPDGRPYLLNSAYLLSPVGNIVGRYDKQHLVPFGEYIPFHHSLLFFLDKLVEGIGDFEAGTDPTVLAVPQRIPRPSEVPGRPVPMEKGAFGVVICYEVIFPDLVRQFAEQGADFMVTITNDAWFGHSAAPYQHFGMVVFRAVENRRAFARAANTGVSGFIDPYGRVLQASPIFTEQAMTGTLPLIRAKTFYTEHGDVFAYACVIIAGLCLLFSRPQSPAARRGW
jgi:apolipoprotein N-acyltransferase